MLSCEGADFSKVLKRYDIDLQVEMTPQEMAEKLLPADPVFHKVAEEVMYMRFKTVGPVVAEAIKVKDPLEVINNGLVAGMEIVAKLYAEHVYYLPEIMMAAKTMEIGIAIAEKQIPGGREAKATVVMHAAEGDPHDIGKNIVKTMLTAGGYIVNDLGKDVAPSKIAETVKAEGIDILCMSTLMTPTMDNMKNTIDLLKEQGTRGNCTVTIGGPPTSPSFAEEIGADHRDNNAQDCVNWLKGQ
mgnify:CR=1 FL=1